MITMNKHAKIIKIQSKKYFHINRSVLVTPENALPDVYNHLVVPLYVIHHHRSVHRRLQAIPCLEFHKTTWSTETIGEGRSSKHWFIIFRTNTLSIGL